ncbi:MAG TPA: polysaccharide deacetylase family protein [Solirubrobacteraceae bacterium]|nr:polysaccharide deacetylase family protein [Solirubrobacteraceae bacterium]
MSFRGESGRPGRTRKSGFPITPGRIAALGSLVAVAAVVLVIVLDSVRSPSSHPSTASSAASIPLPPAAGHTSRTSVRPGAESVPILVYHVINAQPSGSSANPALYVPTSEFSSQMQALKAAGWHAVTLDELERYWTRGTGLGPGKPFVITFDNGYASQYANALPVLKGLGWVAVENLQLTGLTPSEGGLTNAQIRGLVAAGWELDTQGLDHTDLTALDPAQLASDLSAARQMLQSSYGAHANWFSYPSGDYNPTVTAAVRAAGYVGATTVNQGWASPQQDRFRLPRLAVTAGTTPSQLLAQIATAKATTSTPSSYTGVGLA